MSTPPSAARAAITRVVNFDAWFFAHIPGPASVVDNLIQCRVLVRAVRPDTVLQAYECSIRFRPDLDRQLAVIRHLYGTRIGEIGCLWAKEGVPISYRHAAVKFGDLFDFYTTSDGVLELPSWCSMRFAVEQFLREDPRIKFHPSRVRQFIDEHGVDELETME